MQAKEFLLQIKKLDKLIENKLVEIQQWKDIATNATSNMTGDKVDSTPNPRKTEDAICKYIDLESEAQQEFDKFIKAKNDVISVIERLNVTEYDFLHKVYVQGFTLQDVANKYDMSYSWATTTHGIALKHVQIILNKREETKNEQRKAD